MSDDSGLRWFAIYTRSRYEKRVNERLKEMGVEAYLPLVKSWRVWSDRKKQIDVPLFSSYLFVRTHEGKGHEYFDILNTPGVVRFITFEGKAVVVPDAQIDALKRLNSQGIDMEVLTENPPPGTPVTVIMGPMKGISGEVISVGKNKKIILRMDALDKSVTINIPLAMVEVKKLKS